MQAPLRSFNGVADKPPGCRGCACLITELTGNLQFEPLELLLLSAVGACGGGGNGSESGVATLTWVAPTQRVNGAPLDISEVAGCRVSAGRSTLSMQFVDAIDDLSQWSYLVTDLLSGTYCFYVTAVDTEGLESPPSEIKSKTI